MPAPITASSDTRTVLSVSELNRQARITIEERFSMVWVMGEMSNFARPRSGHWYFSLKDDTAQVRCAMFANRNRAVQMQPGDGQLILVRGRVSLYEGRGDFQIIVDHMEPAGEGALRQAFDRLKVKLSQEGLFDQDRKSLLPAFPRHCAVITSPTGAAIKDVLAVWRRRFPALRVTLVPTAVQGEAAQEQILRALQRVEMLKPDVVLLTRGGGSLEDLWSFNLEPVARALAACPFPTVCAVGHEIDITICDFVADVRAATPSAAAELIVPEAQQLSRLLASQQRHLHKALDRRLELHRLRIDSLARRVANPRSVLEQAVQRVDDANGRLVSIMHSRLRLESVRLVAATRQLRATGPGQRLRRATDQLRQLQHRLSRASSGSITRLSQRLAGLSRMLHSVSPLPTLARGYVIITDEQRNAVTSVRRLSEQQTVRAYFADGSASARIQTIDTDQKLEE